MTLEIKAVYKGSSNCFSLNLFYLFQDLLRDKALSLSSYAYDRYVLVLYQL